MGRGIGRHSAGNRSNEGEKAKQEGSIGLTVANTSGNTDLHQETDLLLAL